MAVAMSTLAELWGKADAWFRDRAPHFLPLLSPGTSEDKMKQLEVTLGVTLPLDFKESYRVHDGFRGGVFFGTVHACNTFLNVDEIVNYWSAMNLSQARNQGPVNGTTRTEDPDRAKEIRFKPWDPRWIPFGEDGGGNAVCLDLAPTEDGQYGQVIQWYSDDSCHRLLAPSFTEFLKSFVESLEKDDFRITTMENDGILSLVYKLFED